MTQQHLSTILFDLGNVLFDLDIPATERGLIRLLGPRAEEFQTWADKNRFFNRYETGDITDIEFVDQILDFCPPHAQRQEIIDAWNAMLVGIPVQRLEWLRELKMKYRVALLSNTNAFHIQWVQEYLANTHQVLQFEENHFHRVYYSHEIGYRKPDREAYQHVLDDLAIRGQEMLFIDDMADNILCARDLGIHAIRHTPGKEIMKEFQGYVVSVSGLL